MSHLVFLLHLIKVQGVGNQLLELSRDLGSLTGQIRALPDFSDLSRNAEASYP